MFLDEAGRLREHTRIDNLMDEEHIDEFYDLLKRRRPNVIVVGGFSITTAQLARNIKSRIGQNKEEELVATITAEASPIGNDFVNTPVIYSYDQLARLYQNSKRAAAEFSALTPVARYCIGLARYIQSPINEYAALGSDIMSVTLGDGLTQQVMSLS